MTLLDWGLLVLWLGIALSGSWKGVVRIVFVSAGAIVGGWLAVVMGPGLAPRIGGVVPLPWLAALLARLLPLVGCLALCLVAAWGVHRSLEACSLGWLNRVLGALLTGAVGGLVLGLLVASAAELSPAWREACERSLLAPHVIGLWRLARSW